MAERRRLERRVQHLRDERRRHIGAQLSPDVCPSSMMARKSSRNPGPWLYGKRLSCPCFPLPCALPCTGAA